MLLMYMGREYAERFPERHHPGPRQLLVQHSGEIDRTGLKILENNTNIQSIISVNTNILLRRFRLKYLVLQGTPQLRKHPIELIVIRFLFRHRLISRYFDYYSRIYLTDIFAFRIAYLKNSRSCFTK
jgi:hypothetical protein